jgi:hypothetical protein
MGISRKQALKQIGGKSRQIESHLDKMELTRSSKATRHWRAEVEAWLFQVEGNLPSVGNRTAEQVR